MRLGLVCTFLLTSALAASAQVSEPAGAAEGQLIPPPSSAFNDLACGPILLTERNPAPPPPLRVIGSQDTSPRGLFAHGDTLVVSGGANAGLAAGQQFFVRRRVKTYGTTTTLPPTVHTAGWVRILGVDTMLATATVVHACDGVMVDDYLEAFAAPQIAARPLAGGTPQYENMGRIVTGLEGMQTGAGGNLMTIDRGSEAGVAMGQRFLVLRDKRDVRTDVDGRSPLFADAASHVPLVEIGEVLVVAVRPDHSTVQILQVKDAVISGDLVAPIR